MSRWNVIPVSNSPPSCGAALPTNETPGDENTFRKGLAPLVEQKKLAALLVQFPWSFKNIPEHREYLAKLIERLGDYPLVIEVRHGSWDEPDVLAWLREKGVAICNIDQPVIGKSLRPSALATSTIGYVRIHGRNAEQWFAKNENASERYDYLYRLDELVPWAKRIREIAGKTSTVYVIANNHSNAKSVANAFQLGNLISGERVTAPASLIERYPALAAIASAPAPVSEPAASLFPV